MLTKSIPPQMTAINGADVPIRSRIAAWSVSMSALLLVSPDLLAEEPRYSVVSPLGEETVQMIAMPPRLDTLSNKTLCMIGNDAFKINVTMPAIEKALGARYAGLEVVPYTALPQAQPGAPQVLPESIQSDLRAKGCDAVISGNGG